jgi:hypothetical protein
MNKHLIFNTLSSITLVFVLNCSAFSQQKPDSTAPYNRAKIFLADGNHAFYKFGNVKPINLIDAFCIFLTGDDERLTYFKNLDIGSATAYALNKENNLMRYDWGCESFMEFPKYMISRFDLWAPKLQYQMAVQCFHIWMNYREPNFEEMAKELRKSNKELNKQWRNRFQEFSRYANNDHLRGKGKRKYQRFLRKSRACSL